MTCPGPLSGLFGVLDLCGVIWLYSSSRSIRKRSSSSNRNHTVFSGCSGWVFWLAAKVTRRINGGGPGFSDGRYFKNFYTGAGRLIKYAPEKTFSSFLETFFILISDSGFHSSKCRGDNYLECTQYPGHKFDWTQKKRLDIFGAT